MAENGQKRDPSSHRTKGQIARMNAGYDKQPHKIKERTADGKARKMLGLKVGDPRDAHHVKPQRSGGATTKANLRPLHRSKNRAWEAE
jgi:hypothetical protein